MSRIRFLTALLGVVTCLYGIGAGYAFTDDFEYVEPSSKFSFHIERFKGNPIIHRDMPGLEGRAGRNINGPSLIRVPDWVENPLGKYYLYFAHHTGAYIRMAYTDNLAGPWTIHEGGVLHMHDTPSYHERNNDHIASPDVLIDHKNQVIRMYYHGMNIPNTGAPHNQMTFVADSQNGLSFNSYDHQLGRFYFRVFEHSDGNYYALAKYGNEGGVMYRSADGINDFEEGPRILPRVRHMALWEHGGHLYVFFSRGRDRPEHIMVSRVENLEDDWHDWTFTTPQSVLFPELEFEGVSEPITQSNWGAASGMVHQLRDPAIFEDEGKLYLLYSAAGEHSIAIAEMTFIP